jgi:hypothetical protein
VVTHAPHRAILSNELDHLGSLPQRERGVSGRFVGDEVQEVPLRDHRNVLELARQRREVAKHGRARVGHNTDAGCLLMRQSVEALQQIQLIENLQGGGVDGVTAKVAEEVRVLLQHDNGNPRSRQKQTQHRSGRSATDDAACGHRDVGCGPVLAIRGQEVA